MNEYPIERCPYCGGGKFGVGWQHREALVTFRKHGFAGNRLKHLICKQCGAIVYSSVAEPESFPSSEINQ